MQVIEEQKRGVVINAHMISDLVKINFDSNNMRVNEIVHELKKILAVKVDLFDKLYDKQVNGVVSTDVVKRLFSGKPSKSLKYIPTPEVPGSISCRVQVFFFFFLVSICLYLEYGAEWGMYSAL